MSRANSYKPRQIDWLRTHAARFDTLEELTEAFNHRYEDCRTVGAIQSTLKREGIQRGRRRPQPARRLLDPDQHAFLEDAYTRHSIVVCTSMINIWWRTSFTVEQIKSYTSRHKMLSGRTGRFEKGQIPANAGTKGVMKPNRASFKKGRPAHEARNYVPVGSLRFTRDGYMERKVTDDPTLVPARRWIPEHRLIWEAAYGPVPDGHVVVFLDGDRLNFDLENLRCVPRGVLGMLNKRGLNESTGEARKAGILTCELELRANQRRAA